MEEIIELLKNDARLTVEDIAAALNRDVTEVKQTIQTMEQEGIILKYSAVVNDEKLPHYQDKVVAMIEIGVNPARDKGFDDIAERIYNFPQVKSLYLMSGKYDLLAMVEGDNLKEVAFFVSNKLATLEDIKSTATHFMLKKYKENGTLLNKQNKVERLNVSF